jgi:hypothetical protein
MTSVDYRVGSRQWLTLNFKDAESIFATLTNPIKKPVSSEAEGRLVTSSQKS